MASFYIATTLSNNKEHNRLRDFLVTSGHHITYDWTNHCSVQKDGIERISEVASLESKGIENADYVFVIFPACRATHTELGMAIALGKRIVLCGQEENKDETCAFYHHPNVDAWFDSLDQFIQEYKKQYEHSRNSTYRTSEC